MMQSPDVQKIPVICKETVKTNQKLKRT